VHAELSHALEHIKQLATDYQPAELLAHYTDGTLLKLGPI
jgi:hypothetical protein